VVTRVLVVVVVMISGAACSAPPPASGVPVAPPVAAAGASEGSGTGSESGMVEGVAVEAMNSGGYTYARLTGARGERWMAAAAFPIALGATIRAVVDMPMRNFRSRTLNREFAEIDFVRDVVMDGTPVATLDGVAGVREQAMADSHAGGGDAATSGATTLTAPVAAIPGTTVIAEVWAKRATLSGRTVVVRGRIVKVNLGILGANWYHLQDGSGVVADGTHDLVVTSAAEFTAGEVVTASGVLTTGKDFGAGYAYEAIVERADLRK
jgi:hypothetical protein